jgi:ATP-binding cassette subfamily C protein LapB
VAALQEVCADKTMLIVTHRNPILAMVDRVFVLENGTVVADQTPQQLGLKKN